jgi:hypothetical protein
MTKTLNTLDLSDVAMVDPRNLALAMQHLIDTGRGLAMLRGVSREELREVDAALAGTLRDEPMQRLIVLIRLRCLTEVFRARRLSDLFLRTGFNLIAPAVEIAARMRLNADRGFNPVKFERALVALMAKIAAGDRFAAETGLGLAA